jgi:small subunit ribosomal protein S20
MPNIKSQKKRVLTNEKARQRNIAARSKLRTLRRTFRETLASGDQAAASTALHEVTRAYDKAASDGLVHKNNAANHKSKLTKELAKASTAS